MLSWLQLGTVALGLWACGGPSKRLASDGGTSFVGGRVVDVSGRKAEGADIEVGGLRVPLGDGGLFRFHAAPGPVLLKIGGGGWFAAEKLVTAPVDDLEVVLYRALNLRGVVQGGAGGKLTVACAGAAVEGEVAPDGNFTLALALPDEQVRCSLRVLGPGWAAYAHDVGPAFAELKTTPAPPVEVRVVDDRGRQVSGARLTLIERDERRLPALAVVSDGEGRAKLPGLAGAAVLAATADGYLRTEPQLVTAKLRELKLIRGATLTGVVVDEAGRPVAKAAIDISDESDGSPLFWPGAERPPSSPRFEPIGELGILHGIIPFAPAIPLPRAGPALASDEQGTFRVAGLPPGRVRVAARHPDFAGSAPLIATLRPGETAEVRLTLTPGATLAGRVVDERSRPIEGAEISWDGRVLARSDGAGRFSLTHLEGAQGTVGARHSGHLAAERQVVLGAHAEVELVLRTAEGRLTGVVLDERAMPLPGARVTVAGRELATDPSGRFHADDLTEGSVHVAVRHPDFAPFDADVSPSRDELRINLVPGAGVEGSVRADRGSLPIGVTVDVEIGGNKRRAEVARDGRFTLWGLPSGPAEVVARAPGFVAARHSIELTTPRHPRQEGVRDVDLVLEEAGSVSGRVLDDRGDARVGVMVEAGGVRSMSGRDGTFRIEGLPEGPTLVHTIEHSPISAEITVHRREVTQVDLRMP
jgi:hypothetical protein